MSGKMLRSYFAILGICLWGVTTIGCGGGSEQPDGDEEGDVPLDGDPTPDGDLTEDGDGDCQSFVTLGSEKIEFGAVLIGNRRCENLEVHNSGSSAVTLTDIRIYPEASAEFRLFKRGCNGGVSSGTHITDAIVIGGGMSYLLGVEYEPVDNGKDSAQVAIITNEACGNPHTAALSSTCKGSCSLELSPAAVDFGVMVVDSVPNPRSVTITNRCAQSDDNVALEILDVRREGDARFTFGSCSSTNGALVGSSLNPGQSIICSIGFSGSLQSEAYQASFTITTRALTDCGQEATEAVVTADAQVTDCRVLISPPTLDFGEAYFNRDRVRDRFLVINQCPFDMVMTDCRWANHADFTVDCPVGRVIIAAGLEREIDAEFHPTQVDVIRDTLSMSLEREDGTLQRVRHLDLVGRGTPCTYPGCCPPDSDFCQPGQWQCSDSKHLDRCDTLCSWNLAEECPDGSFCSTSSGTCEICIDGMETCSSGEHWKCVGTEWVLDTTCDDQNWCTYDICTLDPADADGCIFNRFPDGTPCDDNDPLTVDDRCRQGVCAGGPICTDDGVCCANGRPVNEGGVCRPAAGDCDIEEKCDGNGGCPADGFKTANTPCGSLADTDCDNPDSCDAGGHCLPNHEPGTLTCRPAAGDCDVEEKCDGNGACPSDELASEAVPCRNANGSVCDIADFCTGLAADCPDVKSTNVCREGTGDCDYTEICDGVQDACPADRVMDDGSPCDTDGKDQCLAGVCRDCTDDDGCADLADDGIECSEPYCDGNDHTCRHNLAARDGQLCGDLAATVCDGADSCAANGVCQPNHAPDTRPCRASAGVCDLAETCDGQGACTEDGFKQNTVTCRPTAGVCDEPETCSGSAAACPDDLKSSAACRVANGECDLPESCDGVGNDCPDDDVKQDGTTCGSGDQCLAGVCEDCLDDAGCLDLAWGARDQECTLRLCGEDHLCDFDDAIDGIACGTQDQCAFGACRDCYDLSGCSDLAMGGRDSECAQKTCAGTTCDFIKATSGTPCDMIATGNQDQCDGQGMCVDCVTLAGCTNYTPDSEECTDVICRAGACDDDFDPSNTCADSHPCTTTACVESENGCGVVAVTTGCFIDGICIAQDAKKGPTGDDSCKVCSHEEPFGWKVLESGEKCDDGDPGTNVDTCQTSGVCRGTEALVAYYKFDSMNARQLVDSSGNNFHGTVIDNVSLDPNGKCCGSYRFDGRSGYARLSSSPVTQRFTITGWFYLNEYPVNDERHNDNSGHLISAWEINERYSISIRKRAGWSDYKLAANVSVSGNDTLAVVDAPIALNTWYFWAMTWDGRYVRAYLNGSDNTGVYDYVTVNEIRETGHVNIGCQISGYNYLPGNMDEVRFYDRALQPDAIDFLYTSQCPDRECPDFSCTHPPVTTDCDNGWCRIPAGCFTMGSPEGEVGREPSDGKDETLHQVLISMPFSSSDHEVTRGEFSSIMGYIDTAPCDLNCGKDSCPVGCVSWHEALAYANGLSVQKGLPQCFDCSGSGSTILCELKDEYAVPQECLGYRLPTEAEWEYSARAGAGTAFYNGDSTCTGCNGEPNLNPIAWYCANSDVGDGRVQHDIKEKAANAWGLYDVLGNNWEYTWDWAPEGANVYSGIEVDPVGASTGTLKIRRGGDYSDPIEHCRLATRLTYPATGSEDDRVGFRIVRTCGCGARQCGDDDCGNSCGTCEDGMQCSSGYCVANESVGCSDGTREGFSNISQNPNIASCSGGWSLPGVTNVSEPACGRVSGNHSANPAGTGCNITDLCAEGWHVCSDSDDFDLRSPGGCTGGITETQDETIFISAQSGPGSGFCGEGANDVFGCSNMPAAVVGCGGLNGFIATKHPVPNNSRTCGFPSPPWYCDVDGFHEADNIIKNNSMNGGALCCRDCVYDCDGKLCGDDGCGGSCGTCDEGLTCNSEGQCTPGGIEWITIPSGTFNMGFDGSGSENKEKPVHAVNVPAFEMSKSEITIEQYKRCVLAGVCSSDNYTTKGSHMACDYNESTTANDQRPMNCVNWHGASEFCQWVGGRLPSEAEWEYEASGGSLERTYPWGEDPATCNNCVMGDQGLGGCGMQHSWPVCSKSTGNSVHGLCDMSGNVWEWVQDWYHSSYSGNPPTDGGAWEEPAGTGRVLKGNCWNSDVAPEFRASYRTPMDPSERRGGDRGFRCARDLPIVNDCAGQEEGTRCNDNNPCTDNDACAGGGTCEGIPNGWCWFDPETRYLWQNPPANTDELLQPAIEYCDHLNLGSYDDWGLPTISQLRSLISGCANTGAQGPCGVTDETPQHTYYSEACEGCSPGGGNGVEGCYWPTELSGPCDGYYWSRTPTTDDEQYWSVGYHVAWVTPHHPSMHGDKHIRCVKQCFGDCNAKQCGPDGCGGQCGACGAGETCNAEGQCEQSGEPPKEIVLTDTTVIIPDHIAQTVDNTTCGVMTFPYNAGQPPFDVAPGDTIVSGYNGGFLCRVLNVQTGGGVLTLVTEPGTLSDVIASGTLQFSVPLEIADPGGKRGTNDLTASLTIPSRELYNNHGLTVSLRPGSLVFQPDLSVRANYGLFEGPYFRATVSGTLTADAGIDLELNATASIDGQVTIYQQSFPFYFQAGPLPVAGRVIVSVKPGFSASAGGTATASYGARASRTVTAGAEYSDHQWRSINVTSQSTVERYGPDLDASVGINAEVRVDVQSELLLYETASANILVAPRVEGDVTPHANWSYDWNLDACVWGGIGAEIEIFHHALVSYDRTLFNRCWDIWNGSGCINQCSSAGLYCSTPGTVEGCGEADDGDNCLDRVYRECSFAQTCQNGQCVGECTSGQCCDTVSQQFKTAGTTCGTPQYQFLCLSGTGCDTDITRQKRMQRCTGNSADCTGNWSDWAFDGNIACSSSQTCVAGQSSCAPCAQDQCTSGPCCNVAANPNTYKSISEPCEYGARTDYRCVNGSECGNDIEALHYDRYCPGSSEYCTGALIADEAGWLLWEDCDSGHRCNPTSGACDVGCTCPSNWCQANNHGSGAYCSDANTRVTCSTSGSCYTASASQCSNGYTCTNGQCVTGCTAICQGRCGSYGGCQCGSCPSGQGCSLQNVCLNCSGADRPCDQFLNDDYAYIYHGNYQSGLVGDCSTYASGEWGWYAGRTMNNLNIRWTWVTGCPLPSEDDLLTYTSDSARWQITIPADGYYTIQAKIPPSAYLCQNSPNSRYASGVYYGLATNSGSRLLGPFNTANFIGQWMTVTDVPVFMNAGISYLMLYDRGDGVSGCPGRNVNAKWVFIDSVKVLWDR